MNIKPRYLYQQLVSSLILGTGLVVTACQPLTPPTQPAAPTNAQIEETKNGTSVTTSQTSNQASYLFTATEDGQTALAVLENNAQIETKDFGAAGVMITAINGLAANNTHYWAFYVNDEYANQGVSATVLTAGDTIQFVYEEIDATEFTE